MVATPRRNCRKCNIQPSFNSFAANKYYNSTSAELPPGLHKQSYRPIPYYVHVYSRHKKPVIFSFSTLSRFFAQNRKPNTLQFQLQRSKPVINRKRYNFLQHLFTIFVSIESLKGQVITAAETLPFCNHQGEK